MNILTLDLEITETLERYDERWNTPEVLTPSVVCAHYHTKGGDEAYAWTPDRDVQDIAGNVTGKAKHEIQTLLCKADLVVSFNGERFDFAVLEASGFDMTHARDVSFDIWRAFYEKAGEMPSLSNFAKWANVKPKSGAGWLAPKLWAAGKELLLAEKRYTGSETHAPVRDPRRDVCEAGARHLFESVISYCHDDVELTRLVFQRLVQWQGKCKVYCNRPKAVIEATLKMPEVRYHETLESMPF